MFTLWPTPAVDGSSVIPAAWFNKMSTDMSRAVDGLNGGSYTLSSGLSFSGADVTFNSNVDFAAGVTFDGTVDINDTLEVTNGAAIDVLTGGQIAIESGASIEVNGSGHIDVNGTTAVIDLIGNGSKLRAGTNTSVEINTGLLNVAASSTFTVAGAVTWTSASLLSWSAGGFTLTGGTGTFSSGSTLNIRTLNATLGVAAASSKLTVAASGAGTPSTIEFAGDGAKAVFQSLAKLQLNSGSIFENDGDTTRSGPEYLTGGAVTGLRISVTTDASTTFDGSSYDIWEIASVTNDRSYTLSDPANTAAKSRHHFTRYQHPSAHQILIKRSSDGATIATFPNSGATTGSVDVYWSGSQWRATNPSGDATVP
jgi:hypothetical protein